MKLVRQDRRYRHYRLTAHDLQLLVFALGHYPVPRQGGHRISRSGSGESIEEADALLREALAGQRKKARAELRRWVRSPQRITKVGDDLELRIEQRRREWLLQILNDIRVGAWTQLGSPAELEEAYENLNAQTGRLAFLMDIAGRFQTALIQDDPEE